MNYSNVNTPYAGGADDCPMNVSQIEQRKNYKEQTWISI